MSRKSSHLGSVSDLMAGLMLVFLLIAVYYVLQATEESQSTKEALDQSEMLRDQQEQEKKRAQSAERLALDMKQQAQDHLADATAAIELAENLKFMAERSAKEAEASLVKAEASARIAALSQKEAEAAAEDAEVSKNQLMALQTKVVNVVANYSDLQRQIHVDLKKEFQYDLQFWKAELLPDNTIRFNRPEVLFASGKADITDKFKEILDDFYPRYLEVIFKAGYKEHIEEIRIEGHTSTAWNDALSLQERYLKNAALSQKRALSVLQYCFSKPHDIALQDLQVKTLRANGLSFAKPLRHVDGSENHELSRRVEFRVITDSHDQLREILKILDVNNGH